MESRYIVTITDAELEGRVRVLVVDQKQSKIVHESVSPKDLLDGLRDMFKAQYGDEVVFIEKQGMAELPEP